MSRSSRRKTLSHAEIENFLCDLQTESQTSDCPLKRVEQPVEKINNNESPDDLLRKSIRSLHKDLCGIDYPSEATPDMCSQARKISEFSDYNILPSCFLFPEQFPHPKNSLEAKKAILLSMTPMLTDAETQRKKVSESCKDFTRCRVGKSQGRSSSYEYFDIDTDTQISVEEYCKRYMLFIKSTHKNWSIILKDSNAQSNDTVASTVVDGILSSGDTNQCVPCQAPESCDKISKKESKEPLNSISLAISDNDDDTAAVRTRRGGRRRTLSPSTARNILKDEINADQCDGNPTSSKQAPSVPITESKNCNTEFRKPANTVDGAKFTATDSLSISTSDTEASAMSIHKENAVIQARKRYDLRKEIARWKYCWELVSIEAASKSVKYV
mmetsp:Transcript_9522/g.14327  ORF Transcript_9522/g.14327 Transcript_9522/m.14327 type:complete len:385 (-) Transcript_9522:117-1271(-)